MSKTERNQQLLNWLTNEKRKDEAQIKKSKEQFIKEIKKINREDIFPTPEKMSIWKRIKIVLLGK